MSATAPNRAAEIFGLAALAALWLMVIRQFGPQWDIFPQYNYGWGVPFLCAYLFWQRWQRRPAIEPTQLSLPILATIIFCSLVLATARWAHEANATWRMTTWAMAISAVILSLAGLYLAAGRRWMVHFAFPLGFFLVAVPWPSQLEEFVIQNLTRWNVAATVEVLSFSNIPAMQHGNVIEVSTGMVGIDEACSGIRSLQATLMIALFFGELYRFTGRRRVILVLLGMLLAFCFNVGRTFLLVSVAARQGIEAIGKWHDPAGVMILVGCFAGLWGCANWLRRKNIYSLEPIPPTPAPRASIAFSSAIILLVFTTEMGTELWYSAHETAPSAKLLWNVRWPESQPRYTEVTLPERVRKDLGFDEGNAVRWQGQNGELWQAFSFRWLPANNLTGRVKLQSVKSHRPDVCLPATGLIQTADLGVKNFAAGSMSLPFRRYIFEDRSGPIYVFYCFWEDGLRTPGKSLMLENIRSRFAAATAGVRGVGERIIEIAVTGVKDQSAAEAAFTDLLPQVIIPSDNK